MSPKQEMNLLSIKRQFETQVDEKYRAGDKEHGGNLQDMSELALVDNAIQEAIDQYVFLITLRGKMLMRLARRAEVIEEPVPPRISQVAVDALTSATFHGGVLTQYVHGLETKACTREANHTGPCNGFPNKSCPQLEMEISGI